MDGETRAMHGTPENKLPGGAVPETANEHGGEIVDIGACGAFAVASERDVDVVAQPC